MRRVLIFTYSFPPDLAMGARRPWGLYRHFPHHGWDPRIITASAGTKLPNVTRIPHRRRAARFRSFLGLRSNALGRVAGGMRWVRRRLSEFSANPEYESGWREPAFAAGVDLLAREGADAIISTSPPITTHLVARDLKERTGLPWIADLRDLWAENYLYEWSGLRRALDRRIERRVLSHADALVSVSLPLARTLGSHPPSRAVSITNGFAPEDAAKPDHRLSTKFTITYTGSLYPGKRDPRPLFEAVAELAVRRAINPERLELRFYGRNVDQPSLHSEIAKSGLGPSVLVGGLLGHPEALQRQRESQILLTLDWMDEGQPGVYTGKIFEYLAAHRPILSLGPAGSVVDRLLVETRAGRQCSTVAQIQQFLLEGYREFELTGRVGYCGEPDVIRRYDHNTMAERFADVLDRIVARPRQDG